MKVYPITPVPKPRMTIRDSAKSKQNRIRGMRPAVSRYFAFCQEVRLRKVVVPECGYHVVFVLPMPLSWSQKKRNEMNGKPHQQTPDKDNLEKALLDAVFGDDSHVWDGRATKIWGTDGAIAVYEGLPLSMPEGLGKKLGYAKR